jgi:lysyl-tRNA synthetase class II
MKMSRILFKLIFANCQPTRVERFELYIAGKEVVNAYEELTSPDEQRNRFSQQLKVCGKNFASNVQMHR